MAPYHHLLVHFPIALWTTAVLVILWRTLSDGALAQAAGRVLTPLLALGVLSGIVAYAIGLSVFPLETLTSSPLGRNHLMSATWTLAYWILILITSWRLGEKVWEGSRRWIMLGLGALGGILLTVTGTLGGHLSGSPSAVSQLFRLLGWEVYTTFYVPGFMLALLVIGAVALAAMGLAGRRGA
ncbi:MAG TPA: DUF2231 domain-containing protein [Burkholderiales bacterium]|nr:DUF2231 domain-containing protein [Burkholderiales bacterium]